MYYVDTKILKLKSNSLWQKLCIKTLDSNLQCIQTVLENVWIN